VANILLAASLIGFALFWRRTGFWLPGWFSVALSARTRLLLLAGWLIVVLTTGFSLGDILGGRTQVSKSPVRYATRLHGGDAHVHDLADTQLFWRQVVLQSFVGLVVGIALIRLSSARSTVQRSAV
jgi:hypothetical protein